MLRLHSLRIVAILLLFSACAATEHRLALGQISTGLRPFEGSPYDALATEVVHYSEIGEPEYDEFFMEAAAVRGSLIFAVHAIERAEKIAAGEVKATALDFRILWTVVTDTLPRTQQRAIYLYSEAHRLRDKLAGDFWWRPHKILPVRSAIHEARNNLMAARDLVPDLQGRVQKIHQKIKLDKLIRRSF